MSPTPKQRHLLAHIVTLERQGERVTLEALRRATGRSGGNIYRLLTCLVERGLVEATVTHHHCMGSYHRYASTQAGRDRIPPLEGYRFIAAPHLTRPGDLKAFDWRMRV